MLVHYDPDEHKTVTSSHTCGFHLVNPGKPYAGCTCSSSYSSVRRSSDEIAAIKAERQRREEDQILAKAEAIKAARKATTDD